MVDRVDTENRVETSILEGKRRARVGLNESGSRLEAGLDGNPVCGRDSLFVQLDADDLASRQPHEMQRRAAGATRDIKEAARTSKAQPAREPA